MVVAEGDKVCRQVAVLYGGVCGRCHRYYNCCQKLITLSYLCLSDVWDTLSLIGHGFRVLLDGGSWTWVCVSVRSGFKSVSLSGIVGCMDFAGGGGGGAGCTARLLLGL